MKLKTVDFLKNQTKKYLCKLKLSVFVKLFTE